MVEPAKIPESLGKCDILKQHDDGDLTIECGGTKYVVTTEGDVFRGVDMAKQPWQMTKAEIRQTDGVELGGDMGNIIAQVKADGTISLSDDFFDHGITDRKEIWEHEVAHGLVKPTEDRFWRIVDSGAIGTYNEAESKWEGITAGRNPEETLTQLIANARAGKQVPVEVTSEYPELRSTEPKSKP